MGSVADEQSLETVRQRQAFEYANASAEAGVDAIGASGSVVKDETVPAGRSVKLELLARRLVDGRAVGTVPSDEPLGEHANHRRRHHERLDAHLEEAVDSANGVRGMQR